QVWLVILKVV
ncbi:Sialic acid TRAP transporter permease protein SiaT, partial [Haemophilus influenzae]